MCAVNLQIEMDPDEWEDLGEDDSNGKVVGKFQSIFSVKADKGTGQVVGWD